MNGAICLLGEGGKIDANEEVSYCSNQTGHVVALDLRTHYLSGNISSSMLVLEHFYYLHLCGNDFGVTQILEFITSLTKLRILDLSDANFGGRIPYQLGNLTDLQSLNIGLNAIHVSKFDQWLSYLYKLTSLSLQGLDLREATDWLQVVITLRELDLSSSAPPKFNYRSHSLVNSSSLSLTHLHLSLCGLSNSAYHWLSDISRSLVYLDLLITNYKVLLLTMHSGT